QSHSYTNADLGKPITWTRTPTAEEWESLKAHQFVLRPVYDGPKIFIIGAAPDAASPAMAIQPEMPWYLPAYGGFPFIGGGFPIGGRQPFHHRATHAMVFNPIGPLTMAPRSAPVARAAAPAAAGAGVRVARP